MYKDFLVDCHRAEEDGNKKGKLVITRTIQEQQDIPLSILHFLGYFLLGGERNMKQRIPANSITSKLVLKSMYASGSTGPFIANRYRHRFE